VDLEEGGKGSWREIVSVVRGFARFRPFPVQLEDGRRRSIDSLLFANIPEMAKYARLSDGGRPDDGVFEVVTQQRTGRLRVLATALRAATRGLGPQPSTTHYAFTALAPMPLQLDGELVELEAGTLVTVDIAAGALATVG
jgi:diacylglycerol kinase family enzyme